jgi:hypothetical protein
MAMTGESVVVCASWASMDLDDRFHRKVCLREFVMSHDAIVLSHHFALLRQVTSRISGPENRRSIMHAAGA